MRPAVGIGRLAPVPSHMRHHELMEIGEVECASLLERSSVGRIGFIHEGRPEILPVNFRMTGGSVVIRTTDGARIAELHEGTPVTFEVDGVETMWRTGWSVVVHGYIHQPVEPREIDRLAAEPLLPFAPGVRDHFVTVVPDGITGRKIGLAGED